MRIVVMSDSHRQFGPIQKIIEQQPDAAVFIHLGDAQGSIDMIEALYPDKKFFCVRGNCDTDISLPAEMIIPVDENHRIFAAHGHTYSINYSSSALIAAAVKNGCDIVCYGHTHERENRHSDGLYILNPGSCSCPRDGLPPSYAYIDIVDGTPFIAHVDIK